MKSRYTFTIAISLIFYLHEIVCLDCIFRNSAFIVLNILHLFAKFDPTLFGSPQKPSTTDGPQPSVPKSTSTETLSTSSEKKSTEAKETATRPLSPYIA